MLLQMQKVVPDGIFWRTSVVCSELMVVQDKSYQRNIHYIFKHSIRREKGKRKSFSSYQFYGD